MRITLPDGTKLSSVGRINFAAQTPPYWTVDNGHNSNLDAFCAAFG